MGFRWKLEIGRMIGYVFLPVTTFYIYNQVDFADFFKEDIMKYERLLNTPESIENQRKLKEAGELTQRLRDIEARKLFEEKSK